MQGTYNRDRADRSAVRDYSRYRARDSYITSHQSDLIGHSREREEPSTAWGGLGKFIFACLMSGSVWALYLLRNLVFIPFDLLQAFFIVGVVLLVTVPGTWAIKGMWEKSRMNGLMVTGVAIVIPVILSFIIRDTFAYRLQLVHLGIVPLKEGSQALAGREDRLVDTARSGSPDKVPVIASILVHLGKFEDSRSLLLRVIGLTFGNYVQNESRVLSVPVLLSMPGRSSLRELTRIYDISTLKARKAMIEGMGIFASSAHKTPSEHEAEGNGGRVRWQDYPEEIANWVARLDVDTQRIEERIPELSEWIIKECRKSPVTLMRELVQVAMILPEPFNHETVASMMESVAPTGLQGGRLRDTETERAVSLMMAIPPSFLLNSSQRERMEDVVSQFISSRSDAGVQALEIIKANNMLQMIGAVSRNMAIASVSWSANRDFCMAAMNTIESIWKNRRGMEFTEEENTVWLTLEAMLNHGEGDFSGRAAMVMANRDSARAARVLENKINLTEMEKGRRPGFYSGVMKSLAESRRQTAITMACGAIKATETPQSLKRKAAEILINVQAFECSALLAEYSSDKSIMADPQTRAVLADAATRLSNGHRGPL